MCPSPIDPRPGSPPPEPGDAPQPPQDQPGAGVDSQADPAARADPGRNPDTPKRPAPGRDSEPLMPGPLLGLGRMVGQMLPGRLPRFSRWPTAVRALRHRDYRLLWMGAMASNIGAWMQNVAQAWLILELTNSPLWLGIDMFASDLPVFLLLPLGGVLADRLNRRKVLVWTNAVSALLALALMTMSVTGFLTASRVGWIIALSAMRGVMDSARNPATQALLPTLVSREDLVNAIALNSIQFNISRAVGPALAGLSLAALGVSWSFGLNALSFLGVIAAVALMHPPPRARRATESVLASLRGGLAYAWSRTDLVVLIVMTLIGGMLCSAVTARMLPVVAKQVFAAGSAGYSQMVTMFGIGALIGAGALAIGSGSGEPKPWRALPLFAGLGGCELVMSLGGPFYMALGLSLIAGMLLVSALVSIKTAVLHSSPDAVRGRVISLQTMAARAGMPLGGLLAGALATHLGIRVVLGAYGIALLVLAPLALLGLRRRQAAAPAHPA